MLYIEYLCLGNGILVNIYGSLFGLAAAAEHFNVFRKKLQQLN